MTRRTVLSSILLTPLASMFHHKSTASDRDETASDQDLTLSCDGWTVTIDIDPCYETALQAKARDLYFAVRAGDITMAEAMEQHGSLYLDQATRMIVDQLNVSILEINT